MNRIKLEQPSEYEAELCMLFSTNCVDTNKGKYKDRKQDDIDKLTMDIYNGKLAEVMVYNYLLRRGKIPRPVDFLIYDVKFKSFDADIHLLGGQRIHVKSCMGGSSFPNSWVFQPEDILVSDPGEEDFLVLVVMGESSSYCYIVGANKVIYREPIKKSLNKKVIYEEDIINEN